MRLMKVIALALGLMLSCFAAGPETEKGRSVGNPAAPLMFEIYSDFMCPYCKVLHETILPAIVLDYVKSGKAYLIYREFPLAIPAHVYSREAAAYAVAAARVGKYQEVSDALFRNQTTWSPNGAVWETVAAVLTPDERIKVRALAKDPAVLAAVQRDVERGMSAGVNQTPTLMVTHKLKSQPWTNFADYMLLRGYLDGLLKK
jgi:protein-disulfide isomerase